MTLQPPEQPEIAALRDPSGPAVDAAGETTGAVPAEAGADGVPTVDALPVLAAPSGPTVTARARRALSRELEGAAIPAVQAAAVAAGSFVAGAAVAGLVHRRSRARASLARGSRGGRSALAQRKSARGAEALQIVGTRTLLVDVHVLGTPGTGH